MTSKDSYFTATVLIVKIVLASKALSCRSFPHRITTAVFIIRIQVFIRLLTALAA